MIGSKKTGISPEMMVCLEITKELSKLPGAILFKEPIDPTAEEYENYRKIIKNPQDLGTITRKLEAGEYSNIQAWERDINLIWTNAEQFNGKETYVSLIAKHMAKHCEKLKRKLTMRKISGWMKCLYIWREKLDKLMVSPPENSTIKFFPPLEYVAPDYKPFTDRETNCFIEATRSLNKSEEIKQLAKIAATDPNFNAAEENMVLNVDGLEPRTMYALRSYVLKRFNEMGIAYPE